MALVIPQHPHIPRMGSRVALEEGGAVPSFGRLRDVVLVLGFSRGAEHHTSNEVTRPQSEEVMISYCQTTQAFVPLIPYADVKHPPPTRSPSPCSTASPALRRCRCPMDSTRMDSPQCTVCSWERRELCVLLHQFNRKFPGSCQVSPRNIKALHANHL